MAARRADPERPELWILFSGRADLPWLRVLKPGFRHCLAAQRDTSGWLLIDPLWGRLVVRRLTTEASETLPDRWRGAGFAVLGPFRPLPPRPGLRPILAPLTCVSVCQRLLGLSLPLVVTPWQLWRALGGESRSLLGHPRTLVLTSDGT